MPEYKNMNYFIRIEIFFFLKIYINVFYLNFFDTEEKKPAKEESESEDEDMGFGLFD